MKIKVTPDEKAAIVYCTARRMANILVQAEANCENSPDSEILARLIGSIPKSRARVRVSTDRRLNFSVWRIPDPGVFWLIPTPNATLDEVLTMFRALNKLRKARKAAGAIDTKASSSKIQPTSVHHVISGVTYLFLGIIVDRKIPKSEVLTWHEDLHPSQYFRGRGWASFDYGLPPVKNTDEEDDGLFDVWVPVASDTVRLDTLDAEASAWLEATTAYRVMDPAALTIGK